MEIVLLERIARLGQMGDVVKVKDGFARNFLLPQGKALRANERNLKIFEAQKAQIEAKHLELEKEAKVVGEKIEGQTFILIRQAGESGHLYGSVSTRDIAEASTAGGFTIERSQVELNTPIKETGIHEVLIRLHADVTATISVNVARTEDEAELQAKGVDVNSDMTDEEQDVLALAEEVFESEELAQEAAAELSDEEADSEEETPAAEAPETEESEEEKSE
jgi:large subunit ribosomal protein L9